MCPSSSPERGAPVRGEIGDISEVVPKGFEDPVRLYEVRWLSSRQRPVAEHNEPKLQVRVGRCALSHFVPS